MAEKISKINQGVHQRFQGQAVQAPAQPRLNRVYNIFLKLNKWQKISKINQGVHQRLQGQAVQAAAYTGFTTLLYN